MREPLRASEWRGPTLLLEAGLEKGKFLPPATVTALHAALGEALDHRVAEVTHTIPSDHPDLLAQVVTEFLHRLPR